MLRAIDHRDQAIIGSLDKPLNVDFMRETRRRIPPSGLGTKGSFRICRNECKKHFRAR